MLQICWFNKVLNCNCSETNRFTVSKLFRSNYHLSKHNRKNIDSCTTQPGKIIVLPSSSSGLFSFRSLKTVENSFLHKKAGNNISSIMKHNSLQVKKMWFQKLPRFPNLIFKKRSNFRNQPLKTRI